MTCQRVLDLAPTMTAIPGTAVRPAATISAKLEGAPVMTVRTSRRSNALISRGTNQT